MTCTDIDENTENSPIKRLALACIICCLFMIIEFVGGFLSNSLAIMTDAAHLLSDMLGFVIAILAICISRRSATQKMSFGYYRAEVLGALLSVSLIWGILIWLLYESVKRIWHPQSIQSFVMIITSLIGIGINIIMVLFLHNHSHRLNHPHSKDHSHNQSHSKEEGHSHTQNSNEEGLSQKSNDHNHLAKKSEVPDLSELDMQIQPENPNDNPDNEYEALLDITQKNVLSSNEKISSEAKDNMNLRAIFIHIIGDFIQSIGTFIAGMIIYFVDGMEILDPVCTILFLIIVMFTTIPILRECILILLESAPAHIDVNKLLNEIALVRDK